MNKIIFRIFILVLSASSFLTVRAQSVYAQVSSKQVQVGVPFEYAIVINANPNSYTPPSFNGFDIVNGPMQSTSTQWVNGQTSTQMTITWALAAKKEGRLVIGPAAVNFGSQRMETSAISVDVSKGAPASQGQGGQNDPQFSSKVSGGDLFIRTGISKNKCYVGEQVTIVQKVYCRLQIIGFQKFSQPTYDGFYSQAQESVSKGQLAVENVDGVNYYTYELFRTIAIANKAGKITLTPVEGDVVIRKQTAARPKNIFEQFFGAAAYEDIPVHTRSKPMNIEVLPLPEEGKPVDFNGAVGNFTSKVELSRNEIKANEALNLKMVISGKGNLKLVSPPQITLPEGFETYDPKVSESGSSKTFDYLVIPRNEGEYILKDIAFSYFNLDTRKYVTIPSGEFHVKVLPADPNTAGAQIYSPQHQVKEMENDIRYIKKGNFVLSKTETEFFNSGKHITFLILPLILLSVMLFFRREHLRNNSNQVLVRERKAARMARKQLVTAEKLMQQNSKDAFYAEILTALNNYLGHKLNIPVADLSRDRISSALIRKQVNPETQLKLFSTIDNSEYARYAPGAVSGDLKGVYGDTTNLIVELEEQLNKKTT
jgi:hypothetical protein